jgi:hypothetical protein
MRQFVGIRKDNNENDKYEKQDANISIFHNKKRVGFFDPTRILVLMQIIRRASFQPSLRCVTSAIHIPSAGPRSG